MKGRKENEGNGLNRRARRSSVVLGAGRARRQATTATRDGRPRRTRLRGQARQIRNSDYKGGKNKGPDRAHASSA